MNRMKSYQETEMCLVPMSWYVSSKLSWTECFYHYVWLAFSSVEGLAESNAIGAKVETVLSARLWLQRNNRRLESYGECQEFSLLKSGCDGTIQAEICDMQWQYRILLVQL